MKAAGITIVLLLIAAGVAIYTFGPSPLVTATPGSTASMTAPGTPVSYKVILDGQESGVNDRVNYVIHSGAELRQLWNLIGAANDLPTVDFSKQEVIALFAGQEPTAGYSIAVSGIGDSTSTRMVEVSITKPSGSCAEAQQLTTPFEIAVFDKTDLPLGHNDNVKIFNCLQP